MSYTPKEICSILNISYEMLKFYDKEGLIPGIGRDSNNRRVFSQENLNWLKGLMCLRQCGMSLKDMKVYMEHCLRGQESIPERKIMLEKTKAEIEEKILELQGALRYIDDKQSFYDNVMAGKQDYFSFVSEPSKYK